MRTIIAGGRDCTDRKVLDSALSKCGWVPSIVLCGCAAGADILGYMWAMENDVHLELYSARWDIQGNAAGPIRNKHMAENAEALIALWNGHSKGTANMITVARKMKLKVYVEPY